MKTIRIFIGVGLFFLIIAIAFAIYVWAKVQYLNSVADTATPAAKTETVDSTSAPSAAQSPVTEPIIIKKSDLTESQAKTLDLIGIEGDSIVITPEMYQCAEAKLGAERLDEIVNGASPSFLESTKLAGCL